MALDAEILVAGGGIVGTTLAIALARSGIAVVLVDENRKIDQVADDFDGRAYALSAASCKLLESLGLGPQLIEFGQPILSVRVFEGRPCEGPRGPVVEFGRGDAATWPLGRMVEDRFLRRALLEEIESEPRICRLGPTRVEAHSDRSDRVEVALANGDSLSVALLAGCDGRSSAVARLAGIERGFHDYRQASLVCAIEHELDHSGTAYQFFMASGPLAILPLQLNRSSIVWTEQSDLAQRINALGDNEYLEVLKPRFGDFLGSIALCGARRIIPLSLSVAERFVAGRVALAGDAAQGIHPIAGQGLNLGFRDAAALAEIVVLARRRGEDIGSSGVLGRYERWRRFDSASIIGVTHGANFIFSSDSEIISLIRSAGMAAINRLPMVRRRLAREAAGLAGELPSLMRTGTI
ncbi:MAG: UbiH/UbiF/VisC/COQ6 family ubiquinone biosynthesis hydroxylase [Albidovulum sp.]|nr:UbiH/UbiF/VisC/COQ6 family ubiquinone biosynthesis hydroxylase [Albidovulum sp.]MDE0308131.1 UbiH/UbiF/VisC/COQ6 family ubiquinone biosynthesis hydroxylase [Albidovulum sp.]MDE0533005.1 UbiH/UbiF/VisC/COQ6 family ubiquinone biosynthesis hydroxylase [Albidovulum sp.]